MLNSGFLSFFLPTRSTLLDDDFDGPPDVTPDVEGTRPSITLVSSEGLSEVGTGTGTTVTGPLGSPSLRDRSFIVHLNSLDPTSLLSGTIF